MADFIYLDLATLLKIKPEKTIKTLKIPLGSSVTQGTVIAENKKLLGRAIAVKAPIDGVLDSLEENTGKLALKTIDPVKSPVTTKVTIKHKSIPVEEGCGQAEGKLIYISTELHLKDLSDTYKDKIIAVNKIHSQGVVFKAAALGIRGLVTIDAQQDWLNELIVNNISPLCILVLVSPTNLNKLNHQQVVCDGENKQLIII